MKSRLKKFDLAIRDFIWKIRINFQDLKEKISETVTRRNERDAKRIGQEIAIKERVGIENMDLDIRNDDELIYDIKYTISDNIHKRFPERKWLEYEIHREKEKSNNRIREAKEKMVVQTKILKSDIAKLKSENKKQMLLHRAELANQLKRENELFEFRSRQIRENLENGVLSSDEVQVLELEKTQLNKSFEEKVNEIKQELDNTKGKDIPEIIAKIAHADQQLIDNKLELENLIIEEKTKFEAFKNEKELRIEEIKANPSLEKDPIDSNPEQERTAPTISKKYLREDETTAISEYRQNISELQSQFRNINKQIHDTEVNFRTKASEKRNEYIQKYVDDKTSSLKSEVSLLETRLLEATDQVEIKAINSDIKKTTRQIKRVAYVETIEAEHQYQLLTTEQLRGETKELKHQQKEIHDQIVKNNRLIREAKEAIFYSEKAHAVKFYTEYYSSLSDEEMLKIIPPTKREAERKAKAIDETKNILKAMLYLLPALLLLGVFTFYPIVNSFIVSFYEGYNIQTGEIDGYTLIGNYQTVLAHAGFKQAVLNTGVIVFISVPITVIIGLLIAVALHAIKPLKGFFQTVFFLPYVTNTIAIGLVFAYIFSGNRFTISAGQITGLANQLITLFGGTPIPWLSAGATYWSAMAVILIYGLWNGLAFKIIVFLAGIQGIDKQYYQAAQIDGATRNKQFRKITVPLLSPMILYILITSIIGAFKTYSSVVAIIGTTGIITAGADGSVNLKTIVFYIYDYIALAGQNGMMSYASAAAIILFVIILFFTAIQLVVSKKRVHY